MDLKLTVIGGKNAGRVIAIPGDKFLIGRAEDCHLRPNSDLVSRHHCAIAISRGVATVRDFGSRNGTFVNDQRIDREVKLRSGDHMKVGPLEFEISLPVNLAGQKKPKVQSLEEAAARTVEAAARPADEELDIADWVAQADTDTQSMTTSQSGTVAINTPAPVDEAPPAADPEKESDEGKQKRKGDQHKSPSGIRGIKKPKAVDSQSAAAETLRAFFNRK